MPIPLITGGLAAAAGIYSATKEYGLLASNGERDSKKCFDFLHAEDIQEGRYEFIVLQDLDGEKKKIMRLAPYMKKYKANPPR